MVIEKHNSGVDAGSPSIRDRDRGPVAVFRIGASRRERRNVIVRGRRTSLVLEGEFWDALGEICLREGTTINALCGTLDRRRGPVTLTTSARTFVLSYFRTAAPATMEAPEGGSGISPLLEAALRVIA